MGLRKKVRAMLGLPKRARKPQKREVHVAQIERAQAKIINALNRLPAPDLTKEMDDSFEIHFDPDQPLVTVAVSLYNEPRFIIDAIESLKRQSFQDFEAIIVDDASTDNSRAVAYEAIQNDNRFRIVQHLKNGGVGAARNTALRLSRAPLITFLDADDFLLVDSLELRTNAFLKNITPVLGGIFSGIFNVPEDTPFDFVPPNCRSQSLTQTFLSCEGECPFNVHAAIVRTDILRRLGGFEENLRQGAEDWELWQRVLRHGYIFKSIPKITAVYRARPGSMIRRTPLEHLKVGRKIFSWVYNEIKESEIVPGTPFVFRKGLGQYRREHVFFPRILRFGAMAYMNGSKEFADFLEEFPAEIWHYARYHVNVKQKIKEGVVRYLAVSQSTIDELAPDIDAVVDSIAAHLEVASRAAEEKSAYKEKKYTGKFAVLFASGVHQAKFMAEIGGELQGSGVTPIYVSTEALSGDQGVESYWSSQAISFYTFNSFVLSQWRLSAAVRVVMRPYSGYIRDMLEGHNVIEVDDPNGQNDLPEANGPIKPDLVTAKDEAARAITRFLESQLLKNTSSSDKILGTPGIIVDVEEPIKLAPDYEKIAAFKDRYKGERCFIIGNGPSINNTDLRKLKNEFTFAVNGIFYKKDDMGFDPNFYIVTDSSVIKENTAAIKSYKAEFKFFPTIYRHRHPAQENVQFFLMNRGYYEHSGRNFCVPRFSFDPARRIYCCQSVTLTNIQFAYYMGFKEVYLIGMDFNYVIPASAVVNGEIITSTEEDPNHFHPLYFGPGKTWKDPHLNRIQIAYQYARNIYNADGREIINATKGGKLEVFRRTEYDSLFS